MNKQNYIDLYYETDTGEKNLNVDGSKEKKIFKLHIPDGYTFMVYEYKYLVSAHFKYKLLWRDLLKNEFFGKKLENGFNFSIYDQGEKQYDISIKNMQDLFWKVPRMSCGPMLDDPDGIKTFMFDSRVSTPIVTNNKKNFQLEVQDDLRSFDSIIVKAWGDLIEDDRVNCKPCSCNA